MVPWWPDENVSFQRKTKFFDGSLKASGLYWHCVQLFHAVSEMKTHTHTHTRTVAHTHAHRECKQTHRGIQAPLQHSAGVICCLSNTLAQSVQNSTALWDCVQHIQCETLENTINWSSLASAVTRWTTHMPLHLSSPNGRGHFLHHKKNYTVGARELPYLSPVAPFYFLIKCISTSS